MRSKLSVALVATGIAAILTAGSVSATLVMDDDAAPTPVQEAGTTRTSGTTQAAGTQDVPPVMPDQPAAMPAAVPAAPPTAVPAPAAAKVAQKPTATKPITYVVKRGDNLSSIAAWFALRGFGELFEANRGVIGDDPDLIFPGQRITITGTTVSMR